MAMLLKVEKGTRVGLCFSVNRYVKANDKYIKDFDKNKEWSYRKYWNVKNLYDLVMSQKLSVNDFDWFEDISEFDEIFIKSSKVMKDIFLKVMFNILQN